MEKVFNILIFDYDTEFFEILKNFTEQESFNIKYSAIGNKYKELIKEHKPDVIIINDSLPDISGLELCKTILKEDEKYLIILFTERKDVEYKYQALLAGAIRLIEKPVKIKEFISVIKETIQYQAGIKMNKIVNNWFEFNINSKEEFAREVSMLIKSLLEHCNVDRLLANKISFVLTELQNNAIEHAHKYNIEKEIKISCIITEDTLNIKIEDEGAGFDYRKYDIEKPDKNDLRRIAVERKKEGKRPGGYGLLLAKKVMDEIIFNEKGNIIILSKRLK
ncbi:MAG TPA: ATP-binding protein [bacterium]|nr:ATP-binding protein [bacterium]HOL48126.1 ATP-binding protein [bacterium]HPQ19731.1 ATP-binding protein [bacterium]